MDSHFHDASVFKDSVPVMRELMRYATLRCSPFGMELRGMDDSSTSMCVLTIDGTRIESYLCEKESLVAGFSLLDLQRTLNFAERNDSMAMCIPLESDTAYFKFGSRRMDKMAQVDIKLLDLQEEHLVVPDLEYAAVAVMPSKEFARVVYAMAGLGPTCQICITKDGIAFSADSAIGQSRIRLRGELAKTTVTDMVVHSFSSNMLCLFAKAAPLAMQVTVSMSPTAPLFVEFKTMDGGSLKYYLAPCMEIE